MSLLANIELITAFIVLSTAVIALVIRKKIQEVHVLVNDRMTEALTRIDQLTEALKAAGVDVPDHKKRNGGESE